MAVTRYGRISTGESTGNPVQVLASSDTEWMPIGVTVDWDTVTAAGADGTVAIDGTPYKAGEKVLPFGTILTKITATGLYGPADTTASDGRETVGRSDCGIVNETIKETDKHADLVGLITGGTCWKERVKAGGTNQITFANLEAALPRIGWVKP